jgi:hypothetical protein
MSSPKFTRSSRQLRGRFINYAPLGLKAVCDASSLAEPTVVDDPVKSRMPSGRNGLTKVNLIRRRLPYLQVVFNGNRVVPQIGWRRCEEMKENALGHNAEGIAVIVEARLFNSLSRYAPPGVSLQRLSLPAGSTVGDLVKLLSIPVREVYLVLRNGRDVTASLYGGINTEAVINESDVIALSGPVPYSWGYGAPVV